MTPTSARHGFVTVTALCLLAVVAGLAAGSFRVVVDARRAAHRAARHLQARSASDAALHSVLQSWSARTQDSTVIGAAPIVVEERHLADSTRASVHLSRITDRVFWLAAFGEAASGTSARALFAQHLLLEVRRPAIRELAALISRADVLAGTGTAIIGDDAAPPGWADCPPLDTVPLAAVLVPDSGSARLETGGPIPGSRDDPIARNPATYESLGAVPFQQLASRADITVPAGAILSPAPDSGSHCQAEGPLASSSWGDPARTGAAEGCERHLPVVHARGDLVVTGGRGQGVLLVSGRLRLEGPFLFHGVVIAAGGIETSGQDVTIYGAVLSGGPGVVWLADGELRRSTCAVARALTAARRAYPVGERGWALLF